MPKSNNQFAVCNGTKDRNKKCQLFLQVFTMSDSSLETIVSVKSERNGLQGTIKTTKKKTIKYCFDDSGACCNQYNVVESFPLADLVGQELLEMDLFETNELVKLAKKRKEDNHRGGQGIFVIRCSSLVYKLQMYNYHNGWYSMNFDVFENGKRKWNLAF